MSKVQIRKGFNPQRLGLPDPTGKVFYLASPYSHPDPYIKHLRYIAVSAFGAVLFEHGYNLIEPIGASHPAAHMFDLPTGYEPWKRRDRAFINISDGVIVAYMAGTEESVGVQDELAYASSLGKPIYEIPLGDVLEGYHTLDRVY